MTDLLSPRVPISGGGLVMPAPGNQALRTAYLLYLKRTLQLALRQSSALPPLDPPISELVKEALARDPQAALACFASPTVGTPIHCYANRRQWPSLLAQVEREFKNMAPHLLLELATRRLLPEGLRVDWPHGCPPLASPQLGIILRPTPSAIGWRFESGTATLLEEGGLGASIRLGAQSLARGRQTVRGLRSELAYVALEGSIRLALTDANPIASLEGHPDKGGSVLDLGGHSEDDWSTAMKVSLSWIREHAPDLFKEMELLIKQAVPVGYDPQRHFSASYREAVGTVYLSLHPSPLTLAEAFIHEFQHNKIYAAFEAEDILENAFHPLYPSPVRPDPRPLWGVLMAVHAFLPVAHFLRRLRDAGHPASKTPEFDQHLGDVDIKNHEGMEVLRSHARWTRPGSALMKDLEALDRRHMAERRSRGLPVSATASHES